LALPLAHVDAVAGRVGLENWSDTGTGKTLSGLLASRLLLSPCTVICCPTAVAQQWASNIPGTFDEADTQVHIVESWDDARQLPWLPGKRFCYVIVSYDRLSMLSDDNRDGALRRLREWTGPVGLVIIDEIHQIKARKEGAVGPDAAAKKTLSKRREAVLSFLSIVRRADDPPERGHACKVLALSATPVINTLHEVGGDYITYML
jgi:superfamily II DNA or RNA helicase